MAPRANEPGDDPDDHVPDAARDEPTDDASPHAPGESDEQDEQDEAREPTEGERWAAIVADLADLDGPVASLDPGDHGSTAPGPTVGHAVVLPPELRGRDWDGTGQIDDAESAVDAEEHYRPPDPGPVLGGDPLLTMAWFAAAGMPLFFLVLLIVWRDAPAALIQAAGVVFALGVAALVWRMPNHRGDGPDDDHGAVV
jgi:hypothetical protein